MNKKNDVINFHLTSKCNYRCRYCFAKFGKGKVLSLGDSKKIIDNIDKYFVAHGVVGRINLVGGEPLLVPYLDKIIDYILSKNMKVSIVTNGSLLTPERIKNYSNRIDTIGISVDSVNDETNRLIGRNFNGNVVTKQQLEILANEIKQCGIKLKINTVVSKYNLEEDLNLIYNLLAPERKKVFQMVYMQGVNDDAKAMQITDHQFEKYCNSLNSKNIVKESSQDMLNSYIMINPFGKMVTDKNGCYEEIGDCITENFKTLLDGNSLECEKFSKRYLLEG